MEKKVPFVCPVCGEKIPYRKAWFLSVDSVVACQKCGSKLKPEGARVQRISFVVTILTSLLVSGGGFFLSRVAGLLIGIPFMIASLGIALCVFRVMNIKTVFFNRYQ